MGLSGDVGRVVSKVKNPRRDDGDTPIATDFIGTGRGGLLTGNLERFRRLVMPRKIAAPLLESKRIFENAGTFKIETPDRTDLKWNLE